MEKTTLSIWSAASACNSLLYYAHLVELALDRRHERTAIFILEDRLDVIVEVLWASGADDKRVDCRVAKKPEVVEFNRREFPCRYVRSAQKPMVETSIMCTRRCRHGASRKGRQAGSNSWRTAGIGHFFRGHVEMAPFVGRRDNEYAHVMLASGFNRELVAVEPSE